MSETARFHPVSSLRFHFATKWRKRQPVSDPFLPAEMGCFLPSWTREMGGNGILNRPLLTMLRTCANSLFSPDSRYCVDNAESTIIVLSLQPTDLEWSVDESCWIRISGILRWKRRSYSRCFFENRKILFCRFCLTGVPRFGVLDWLHAIGNGSSDVDSCILRHMI